LYTLCGKIRLFIQIEFEVIVLAFFDVLRKSFRDVLTLIFLFIYLFFWVIAKNEEKRGCDFFKWLDPKICAYGERVVSMLMDWHEKLKSERALIETTIANEVSKCKLQFAEYKSKMEVEAANYAVKVERQKTKFRAMQMKYRFALAFSWGLLIVFLFYPSSNILGSRLMLP
jgi:hypothetical protein